MVTKEQALTLSKSLEIDDVYVEITDKAGKCRNIHYVDFLKEIEEMSNLEFLVFQMRENISVFRYKSFMGTLNKDGSVSQLGVYKDEA